MTRTHILHPILFVAASLSLTTSLAASALRLSPDNPTLLSPSGIAPGSLLEAEIEDADGHPDDGAEEEILRLRRRVLERDSVRLERLKATLTPDSVIAGYYARQLRSINPDLVFHGMRYVRPRSVEKPEFRFEMDARETAYDADRYAGILYADPLASLDEEEEEILSISSDPIPSDESLAGISGKRILFSPDKGHILHRAYSPVPEWLRIMQSDYEMIEDLEFLYMIEHPEKIRYAYWQLPVPPELQEDDMSFKAFLNRMHLPPVSTDEAILPEEEIRRINWLHNVSTALQFSQAYISRNWYQGGNDYLALLFNFNWGVALNTVYHPNLMFTSDLSYKLAINSNSKESLHRYSIAQDQFQYNLKAGVKAFQKWFYSYNLQFKTQFFNSYPADSPTMNAAFLAPADLNMGLGMTYNLSARNNTLNLSASISPLSYNLKACMGNKIDPALFNIAPGRHTRSEIGSNGEVTLNWDITANISWKSRLFLFTDYHYFQADWENTLNFSINRFLSTQLYICPRYDSSTDFNSSRWHYWMLKEILSFGLSFSFATAP